MKNLITVHRLLIIALFLLAGCEDAPREPGVQDDGQPIVERSEINYAEFKIALSTVSRIAIDSDLDEPYQLDINPISLEAGPNVVQSLRSTAGSSGDLGNLAIEPVAAMIASGAEPVIIATTISGGKNVKLVTFEKSGISADPTSLQGKRIGVVLDTIGESYLLGLLDKAGLTADDVQIVHGLPTQLISGVNNDSLDAAVLWSPFVKFLTRGYEQLRSERPKLDRGEVRVFNDPSVFELQMNVVTTRDHLERKRPELVKVLRSLMDAEKQILADSAKAQRDIESWLGLQAGDLDDFFSEARFQVFIDTSNLKGELRKVVDRVSRKKGVPSPESLDRFIDVSLLAEVDASRVLNE